MKKTKILVVGASGQIGTDLTTALAAEFGPDQVLASDIHESPRDPALKHYISLDVLNEAELERVVTENGITQIYLLAAMLSVNAERNPDLAWKLNVQSLLSVLHIAKEHQLDKVFWPSSIAVFGATSPRFRCPQHTRIEPDTIYGISKRTGEYWCNYYFEKYGVDVRSLRYPGLISHSAPPGGGTTDYAVDIFHQALEKGAYTCYLSPDNSLPMMYMADAVRAALELMRAPRANIRTRTAYNIAGLSFAPSELVTAIRRYLPDFQMSYSPDFRDAIARSWPASIRDDEARKDWGWQPAYPLARLTETMLRQLSSKKNISLLVDDCLEG
jgi:nucleoside-diphosphate-sugar epimerase